MNRLLLFICLSGFYLTGYAQHDSLRNQILSIIKGKNATVGVAVNFDGKSQLTINDNQKYPMMSVYKLHVAMALLDYMEKNNLSMNTEIHIKKEDLLPNTYSPLRDKHPEGNITIPISELLKYTVSQSDNNTCDILFDYIGGPETVETYIKGLGIENIAICCNEKAMTENPDAVYTNWTTPSEAIKLVELFRAKNLFSPEYNDYLKTILIETTTGPNKIKGLLPEHLTVGHKTGNSSRNAQGIKIADNDVGFVTLPNGSGYSVAIFIKDSKENDETNAQIISRISRVIFENYIQQGI
ncbi:class A beta-lactamase, subclass A2 [Bacteroides sp. 519]|uniref:class A beta-lactamase, subclass A2 n=1 Tax=Bacteroides sp. 519 TaxID=2302937 RepID=UPI0013D7B692|nr:class A beta-lactamase, subclass A2 [Bacteroides sp. 519]NDV58568.1 class A beta-lactamase, subclass A2 [Bacteroides sp. 519]